MRAIVTKPFKGKDNNSPKCIQYNEGQVIESPIADMAVAEKWATPVGDEKPTKKAPANKAEAKAPENK